MAILKIMHLSQQDSSVYTSVIHSMYNLLQYASKEGIDKKEFKKRVIEQKIEEYPIDFYLNIVENAEKAVVKNYENITDKQLRSKYIECFQYLNRLGRIEAVKRMEEFIETDKYCKRHEKD